jgi:hypothetical protein
VDNYLGVATGAEGVAERRKLCHQWLKIIDFTVVDDANRPVFIVERLITRREVDDRESAVSEPNPWRKMKAVAVRSAMVENIGHPAKQGAVDFGTPSKVENTSYAAHFL